MSWSLHKVTHVNTYIVKELRLVQKLIVGVMWRSRERKQLNIKCSRLVSIKPNIEITWGGAKVLKTVRCSVDYLRTGYENLTYSLNYVFSIIQNYAWYMVFGGLAFYYIYTKFLKSILESTSLSYEHYKKRKAEEEYAAKYHKNPDLFSARISAQQNRAQKLQEQYEKEAREYQAKLKEREERKRQEVLKLLNEKEGGHRLGGNDKDDNNQKPKSLRSEYNPLMGPGSSNYRPPKRSKCGGGGCGK